MFATVAVCKHALGRTCRRATLTKSLASGIPADGTGPIYVATRNDALSSVIDKCPASRKEDLVFYGQNGYIEDFLKAKDVFSDSTKVLVYMAVAKLGEKPTDGITRLNPEGLTAATGKWAEQVAPCVRALARVYDDAYIWIQSHACTHVRTHTRTHADSHTHTRMQAASRLRGAGLVQCITHAWMCT